MIGHRRSLCGLASQGSHYPRLSPFSWEQPFLVSVLLLQITLDLLLHRPRKSLIEPTEKRWATKRSSSAWRRKLFTSFACLKKKKNTVVRAIYRWLFSLLHSVKCIGLSHVISRVNASRNMLYAIEKFTTFSEWLYLNVSPLKDIKNFPEACFL